MENLLTKEDCKSIAVKYFRDSHISVLEYKISPLANALDGLIGEQYKANIKVNYKEKYQEIQVFFKVLNGKSETMFKISKEIRAFEKEDWFYNILVPEFERLGIHIPFVPKCYFSVPYTVVLEDLSVDCYRCTNKRKPLDVHHCKEGIEILAKFHSTGVLYEKYKSRELGKKYTLLEGFGNYLNDVLFSKEDTAATRWLKCSIDGLFQLIDLIPENSITREKFKSVLGETLNKIISANYNSMRCSILHGDLWSSNFLFKYTEDRIIGVKLIDFQTIKYGPMALDVEQFIMTNTRKSFRDTNEGALLDHYFKTFSENIRNHDFNVEEIVTKTEFLDSCNTMRLPAKIQATVDRSITFMSDEIFGKVIEDEEKFQKFMFSERGKYIVESFNENGSFRELILEDMLELRDLLFSD